MFLHFEVAGLLHFIIRWSIDIAFLSEQSCWQVLHLGTDCTDEEEWLDAYGQTLSANESNMPIFQHQSQEFVIQTEGGHDYQNAL